jgi:hypothetical protein
MVVVVLIRLAPLQVLQRLLEGLNALGQVGTLDCPQQRGCQVGQAVTDSRVNLTTPHFICSPAQQVNHIGHGLQGKVRSLGWQCCCRPTSFLATASTGLASGVGTGGVVGKTVRTSSPRRRPATFAVRPGECALRHDPLPPTG